MNVAQMRRGISWSTAGIWATFMRTSRSCSARLSDRKISQSWPRASRSEEHTSELQSLMRNSYAVSCLKKKKTLYRQAEETNFHPHTHNKDHKNILVKYTNQ